jgi:hypothetical protein
MHGVLAHWEALLWEIGGLRGVRADLWGVGGRMVGLERAEKWAQAGVVGEGMEKANGGRRWVTVPLNESGFTYRIGELGFSAGK